MAKAYWNDDFYQIVTYSDDKKYIIIDGYFYDEGQEGINENGDEDVNLTSRCVEYSGVEMPLIEFLEMRDSNGDFRDAITEKASLSKQYISDMCPEEAEESMQSYYGGKAPVELTYESITFDTPCGCYVDA